MFLPAAQAAWTTGVVFATGPGVALTRAIAESVASVDRAVPISDAGGLDRPLARSLAVESFLRQTLIAFGLAGLLLAAFGTYAVVAQSVARRRREIGVRIALGASPAQIRALAAKRGVVIASVSAGAGAIGVAWSGRLLESFLHGLSSLDPLALAAGPAVTVVVVLAAVAVPAIRAARTNPVAVMRPE